MEDNRYTNLKEICGVQIELDANLRTTDHNFQKWQLLFIKFVTARSTEGRAKTKSIPPEVRHRNPRLDGWLCCSTPGSKQNPIVLQINFKLQAKVPRTIGEHE